nr:GNAT family N-acetyltransferase [Paenibacillus sp. SYP-B3998]
MLKADLDNLPDLELPRGYSLRHFELSDTAVWEHIIQLSFQRSIAFQAKIGGLPYYQAERVLFICFGMQPVATATAWETELMPGSQVGYLHMVGALPEFAGRGLGYAATLAALHRMQAEHRTEAVLETDDFRLPAIRVYWKLGFRPLYRDESHDHRWEHILKLIQK